MFLKTLLKSTCHGVSFNDAAGFQQDRLCHKYFLVNFAKFLRTAFLTSPDDCFQAYSLIFARFYRWFQWDSIFQSYHAINLMSRIFKWNDFIIRNHLAYNIEFWCSVTVAYLLYCIYLNFALFWTIKTCTNKRNYLDAWKKRKFTLDKSLVIYIRTL